MLTLGLDHSTKVCQSWNSPPLRLALYQHMENVAVVSTSLHLQYRTVCEGVATKQQTATG